MLQSNSHIIIKPWVTEKAAGMVNDRKYVFVVTKGANSKQIKEELKRIYNVHAIRINILSMPSESSQKKAIVQLKEGEKIDIIPQ
jgi:ribosomal protein L23